MSIIIEKIKIENERRRNTCELKTGQKIYYLDDDYIVHTGIINSVYSEYPDMVSIHDDKDIATAEYAETPKKLFMHPQDIFVSKDDALIVSYLSAHEKIKKCIGEIKTTKELMQFTCKNAIASDKNMNWVTKLIIQLKSEEFNI